MSQTPRWSVKFVFIGRDAVVRDGEIVGEPNKLRVPGNNGRKVLATEVLDRFGEKLLTKPAWHVPFVLPTGNGGIEVATFTEFAGQERHKHETSIEIYTVLKGSMQIYIDDAGPQQVSQMEEVVILPGTVHEVVEQIPSGDSTSVDFSLLVRVHAIGCLGSVDKFVQFSPDGDWRRWDEVPKEERFKVYRKQGAR